MEEIAPGGRRSENEVAQRSFKEHLGKVEFGDGVVFRRMETSVLSAYFFRLDEIAAGKRVKVDYRTEIPKEEQERIRGAIQSETIRNDGMAEMHYEKKEGPIGRIRVDQRNIIEASNNLLAHIMRASRLDVDSREAAEELMADLRGIQGRVENYVQEGSKRLAETLGRLRGIWEGSLKYTLRNPVIEKKQTDEGEKTVMTADWGLVMMPLYFMYRGRETDQKLLDLAMPLAVCGVFKDKNGNMILQFRDEKANASYPGTIGAPVAGMVDRMNKPGRKVPRELSMEVLLNRFYTEAQEEGFITREMLQMQLVALGEDKRSVHAEAALNGTLNMSHEEYKAYYMESVKKLKEQGVAEEAYPERYVVIKRGGTEKLLREAMIHIPSTHLMPIIDSVLEEWEAEGISEIEIKKRWEDLKEGIEANYRRIDEECIKKTGKPYNPKLTPEAQGLPGAMAELRRLEILETTISYDKVLD